MKTLRNLICLAIAGLLFHALLIYWPAANPQIINLAANWSHDFNLQHLVYNSSLAWPVEIYRAILPNHFISGALAPLLLLAPGCFLIFAIWLMLRSVFKQSNSFAVYTAFLLVTAQYYLFGQDLVIFTLQGWSILLGTLSFFALTVTTQSMLWLLTLLLTTLLCILTTGILCLLPIILGTASGIVFKWELCHGFPTMRDRQDRLAVFGPALIALVALFILPWPNYPEYSALGHVVNDDGLPGNILPLFAPTSTIPMIDRHLMRSILGDYSNWLLILTAAWFLFNRRSWLLTFVVGASLFVWLDLVPSETISQISPLACIERLVPGLFFFPSAPLLMALITSLLFARLARTSSSLLTTSILLGLTLAPIVYQQYQAKNFDLKPGVFVPPNSSALLNEFDYLSTQDSKWSERAHYLFSPSYAVLHKTGLWPLNISEVIKHWKFTSLFKEQPIITASADHYAVDNLIDRNINTRWSPGGGRQTGKEWLLVNLQTPLTLHGVELETGPYHTDFARGLQIWAQLSCPKDTDLDRPARSGFNLLADYPVWQGPLVMTSDGFPYFGGQGSGKVYFDQPLQLGCILIKQTGQVQGFDWSVSQIRVLRYPQ